MAPVGQRSAASSHLVVQLLRRLLLEDVEVAVAAHLEHLRAHLHAAARSMRRRRSRRSPSRRGPPRHAVTNPWPHGSRRPRPPPGRRSSARPACGRRSARRARGRCPSCRPTLTGWLDRDRPPSTRIGPHRLRPTGPRADLRRARSPTAATGGSLDLQRRPASPAGRPSGRASRRDLAPPHGDTRCPPMHAEDAPVA